MAHEIIQDDAFVRMDAMALIGEQFHAIVTDPPYGLGSWDWIKHGDQLHDWHGRWAKLALTLVPPGGHMAVFSGTKHFHHMMLAVEDAGWELRDTLLWLKAGGMPKSRNRGPMGTGLKPGWEPIALFRKPLDGTIFDCAKAAPGERDAGLPDGSKNKHPTVKPIALMQWLTRLLTIPGGRVLDPFAGSGSGGCAAVLDGFDWVGIEEDTESATIARHRIEHWAST